MNRSLPVRGRRSPDQGHPLRLAGAAARVCVPRGGLAPHPTAAAGTPQGARVREARGIPWAVLMSKAKGGE